MTMTRKTTPIFNAKKVNNSAELTIYAPIEDEESWWYDSVSPKGVMRALDRMGNVDEVTVRINSPGGSVFAGLAIYQYLKDHKAKVIVRVDGLAASAASIIAMAADQLIMGTGAMMMAHNPWMVAMGEAKDFRDAADTLDKIQTSLISVYKERTGKSEDELKSMLDATTWLTADEAVTMGFADEVDRKMKVSASIHKGIATFNNQCFDLRAFASIPDLPEEEEQAEEPTTEEPAPTSAEGDGDMPKDLEELKAKHPEIFKAAVQTGVDQERTRITELNALADAPGGAEIVSKAITEGKTAAQAAVDIVMASKARITGEGAARVADANASNAAAVPANDPTPVKLTDEQEAQAHADGIVAEMKKIAGGRK